MKNCLKITLPKGEKVNIKISLEPLKCEKRFSILKPLNDEENSFLNIS